MKKEIKLFNNFVKQYDLKIPELMAKYHHTFRVMGFCEKIAVSLNLSDEDIHTAKLCGLLHDIGRFPQWTEFKTFHDSKSFDHAVRGVELLKRDNFINKFTDNQETADIILESIMCHNKLTFPKLDDKKELFIKIVRDADKFDILLEQYNRIDEKEIVLNELLLRDIYEGRMCKKEDIKTSADKLLGCISWINDLNFKYSYQFLINSDIIKNKFMLLEIYGETKEIDQLKEFVYQKIKEMS